MDGESTGSLGGPDLADTSAQLPIDAEHEQKRRERAIAAKYRGDFSWRVVFECLWGVGGWLAMTVLALKGAVPYGVACL